MEALALPSKFVSHTSESREPRMGQWSWTRASVPSRSEGYTRVFHALASAGLLCDSRQNTFRKVFPLQAGPSIKSQQQHVTFTGDIGSGGCVAHTSVSRKAASLQLWGHKTNDPGVGTPPRRPARAASPRAVPSCNQRRTMVPSHPTDCVFLRLSQVSVPISKAPLFC